MMPPYWAWADHNPSGTGQSADLLRLYPETESFGMALQVLLPIVIARENKWFVASCPILDIATQGKSEKDAKENMTALMDES